MHALRERITCIGKYGHCLHNIRNKLNGVPMCGPCLSRASVAIWCVARRADEREHTLAASCYSFNATTFEPKVTLTEHEL